MPSPLLKCNALAEYFTLVIVPQIADADKEYPWHAESINHQSTEDLLRVHLSLSFTRSQMRGYNFQSLLRICNDLHCILILVFCRIPCKNRLQLMTDADFCMLSSIAAMFYGVVNAYAHSCTRML